MSSTMKLDILAHMPGAAIAPAMAVPSTFNFRAVALQQRRQTQIQPLATPDGTFQAVNDAAQDIEPAIITGSFSGSNRTTTVFTKFLPGTVPRHYWTSTTGADFGNFAGGATGWAMPLPAGTTRSSDPLLSENPYTDAPFPNRTYCSGIAYDLGGGQDGTLTGYNALTVWYSDYPAAENAWTPMVIDAETYPVYFDKPSIATSWNAETRGYTYVATMVRHYDMPFSQDIQVYRQGPTQGFTRVNQMLYLPEGTNSPIITVDSNTGDVYLLWIDTTYNAIQIARSTDMGNTFSAPTSMPASGLLTGDGKICDAAFDHCTRAASAIMAKANAADHSIGVVWHLHETDNTHTDVGFNQFQLSTQTWRWWRGIQVGHPGANDGRDQWNPALDPAGDGSYLITWYDKRNDPLFANNGNSYQVFAVRTHGDGTPIDTSDTVVYNASAAANLTLLSQPPNTPFRYMGEYQDVWEWYGTWYGATTYLNASGQQDVYVMRIKP